MVEAKRRVNLTLVRGAGAYLDEIPPEVELTVLGKQRVYTAIPDLARHFRTVRPRAVLSALTHVNVATIMAGELAGTPARIVISERNQISKEAKRANTLRKRAVYMAVPWIYKKANAIVAVSSGVANDLRDFGRLPEAKMRVINNPVYNDEIQRRASESIDHPWLREGEKPFFLAVGRLSEQKGFDVLLRAFSAVRKYVDCRLIILGDGEDREMLERIAVEGGARDDISLPGFSANPYAFMARAAAFVLSSRWEGFPNALVEAMACGAPIIATDCPSGPREILQDGRFGRLVAVDDLPGLTAALHDTLTFSPCTKESQAHARSFNLATAAARYLDVLEV